MKKPRTAKLPEKMSDLLELAVRDAQAAEAAGAILDMGTWYSANGTCRVCMAGAVLQQTIGFDRQVHIDHCDLRPVLCDQEGLDEGIITALLAIDNMRCGQAPDHFSDDEQRRAKPALDLIWDMNGTNRLKGRAPWDTYLKAAKMLREAGL